jgi:hypothetical protein
MECDGATAAAVERRESALEPAEEQFGPGDLSYSRKKSLHAGAIGLEASAQLRKRFEKFGAVFFVAKIVVSMSRPRRARMALMQSMKDADATRAFRVGRGIQRMSLKTAANGIKAIRVSGYLS